MSATRISNEKDQPTCDDDDKDQKVDINSLDYDSLAKIFMLLPIPERIDMEEVCIKLKEACQLAWYDIKQYKCESSIGRSYDNRLLTQSYLKKILLRCGIYLRELFLSNICNSSIMPFVGEHCKNLTSLECEFNDDSLIHNADHFVQAFTQLDELKCIKIIVTCQNADKTINLFAIINSLPERINEIHLLSKPLCDKILTVSTSFKKFKNLQKLTVHGLICSDSIFPEIAEKTTLVHLQIQLSDEFFLFDKLVNLEHIDLTLRMQHGRSYETYTELSTKVLDTIFCTCKNLKHLNIPTGPYDLEKIPRKEWINFQNLQYLAIFCIITPDLANKIVEYCKNLKHLSIRVPNLIMIDTSIKKLTELENLECLILLGCVMLKGESIIAISNNCKKLKQLEIPAGWIFDSHSSSSVLDEISKLQYLEHLNLFLVIDLKNSTIIAIANNCKYLKSLDIRRSGAVTETARDAITETALGALTKLENLQKLDVSFLNITNSFISKLKGLKELYCVDCKKLTDDGIIQFIKNNPDLDVIDVSLINNITINLVIAADQATKNRTNGIILHIKMSNPSIREASKSIIKSQWLVVD